MDLSQGIHQRAQRLSALALSQIRILAKQRKRVSVEDMHDIVTGMISYRRLWIFLNGRASQIEFFSHVDAFRSARLALLRLKNDNP